jgi:hypothetical protein
MTMSMDTGGFDRVVKQRHDEWYAERRNDRDVRVAEARARRGSRGPRTRLQEARAFVIRFAGDLWPIAQLDRRRHGEEPR